MSFKSNNHDKHFIISNQSHNHPTNQYTKQSNTELTIQCINRKGYNTNTKESNPKNQTLGRSIDKPERKDRDCENEKQTNVSARAPAEFSNEPC